METIADYIQQYANEQGFMTTTNGSWLASLTRYPVDTPDLWTYICEKNGWEIINGNAIQTVALNMKIVNPVNGSWIQAIYQR